ncbi:xanthine dehydrogenase accessory protein XdhC [uncultured Litoreibacter sp.]|uniref:xanthine dehydrogenase accessory protein XdhC n=1 Tax=uncultured Litoreibacter sp. TaxID=1392394 RepID=UPI00260E580B|nr:xanthine dehydrogenase accessory protein XdhC [uncultured Litoreibacter sp.]
MSFDLKALRRAVNAYGVVGRIVIADHKGSAPRETGTSMLVWRDGQSGTIGGGALEFEAVKAVRARLGKGQPQLDKVPLGPALGQCCGGAVTVVSEIFTQDRLDAVDTKQPVYVRRITGEADAPLAVTRAAAKARSGRPTRLLLQSGWLAEQIATEAHPLWIYGAGHVGRALVQTLTPLPDFDITWVDTAADRFPVETPSTVTILPVANPAAAAIHAPQHARHLILTYSHALDLELCHQLLQHGFTSVGLIGSNTKWARFQTRLSALGHAPHSINRITCPIGDPALGKHPQAIALGVASALVMSLRSGEEDMGATGGQATA